MGAVDVMGIAKAVTKGVQNAATHSAKAAARANGVSAAAQSAQGAFNQGSANNANAIGSQRIADMYQFNSGQAAAANAFSQGMWNQTAAYNTEMWERQAEWNEKMYQLQMDFNAKEAQKNRDWSTEMENTRYQRAIADMSKAGLNPILAYGGIQTGAGSGGAASVGSTSMGAASMSPMSGHAASAGTLNGLSASEGNYSGQMEYLSGMLGLFGAAIDGISAAASALSQTGSNNIIGEIIQDFSHILDKDTWTKENFKNPNTKYNQWKRSLDHGNKGQKKLSELLP